MREISNKRPAFRLVGGALAALFLGWLVLGGDQPQGDDTAPAPGDESAAATGTTPDSAVPTPMRLGPGRDGAGGGPSVNRLEKELESYKKSAVYPHWSRPHYDGTEYKLAWNKAITPEVQFNEDPDDPILYAFHADKMHVMFGDSYTSWIHVWRPGRETEPLPAKVKQAWVMVKHGANQGRAIPLDYADAGGHQYQNTFTPAQHEELRDGNAVRIEVLLEVEGEVRRLTRDFTYAARPVVEVVGISDAIVDGSLAVTLDLEVYEPGLHTFEGNCMTGDGEVAISYAKQSYQLETGRTQVDLVFFGKVFHDQAVSGPYLIRDIRGLRRSTGEGQNLHWSHPGTHVTAAYSLADLSPDEWESDEKSQKINNFKEMIARRRAAGEAPPDPVALGTEQGILTPR